MTTKFRIALAEKIRNYLEGRKVFGGRRPRRDPELVAPATRVLTSTRKNPGRHNAPESYGRE